MNYTTEDLAKIKQLVATTDMDNVRVGIQIAKGLGVNAETLASLFTINDVVDNDKYGPHFYTLIAFSHKNDNKTIKSAFETYQLWAIHDINQFLNE